MAERTMRITRLTLAALLALTVGLAADAGCTREPSEPNVVNGDASQDQTPSVEATSVTPLDELSITLEAVFTDLDQPLFVTGAGDDSGRLFLVEKTGRIWVVTGGRRSGAPFLDIADKVSDGSEQGLLGLAFDPDTGSEYAYVNYTARNGDTVISRFSVEGDAALRDSEVVLLTVRQPFANHNGGMIAFGPDGYLYIGLGDGGGAGDPQGNGQNLGTMLGTMLRIDVSPEVETGGDAYAIPGDNPFAQRDGARPEIWAYGLRNPWRFSFDRESGDLWIADVGQSAWEEVNFQSSASIGGENYGWNVFEGSHPYPPDATPPADTSAYTMPVVEYDRQAGKSITGGYVYRGSAQESLWGTYFYADYVDGRIWALQRADDGGIRTRLLLDTEFMISSFGEDDDGELYLTDLGGGLYRLVAE